LKKLLIILGFLVVTSTLWAKSTNDDDSNTPSGGLTLKMDGIEDYVILIALVSPSYDATAQREAVINLEGQVRSRLKLGWLPYGPLVIPSYYHNYYEQVMIKPKTKGK